MATRNENKTRPTAMSPREFVASIEHPNRRADAEALLDVFARVTGMTARMWGPSIIGYGEYHYKYESGREGDFLMTGFSPRKAGLVFYIMPGYAKMGDMLERLGKHRIGKSCLYVNKLTDLDLDVLEEIIVAGIEDVRARYETIET